MDVVLFGSTFLDEDVVDPLRERDVEQLLAVDVSDLSVFERELPGVEPVRSDFDSIPIVDGGFDRCHVLNVMLVFSVGQFEDRERLSDRRLS